MDFTSKMGVYGGKRRKTIKRRKTPGWGGDTAGNRAAPTPFFSAGAPPAAPKNRRQFGLGGPTAGVALRSVYTYFVSRLLFINENRITMKKNRNSLWYQNDHTKKPGCNFRPKWRTQTRFMYSPFLYFSSSGTSWENKALRTCQSTCASPLTVCVVFNSFFPSRFLFHFLFCFTFFNFLLFLHMFSQ